MQQQRASVTPRLRSSKLPEDLGSGRDEAETDDELFGKGVTGGMSETGCQSGLWMRDARATAREACGSFVVTCKIRIG